MKKRILALAAVCAVLAAAGCNNNAQSTTTAAATTTAAETTTTEAATTAAPETTTEAATEATVDSEDLGRGDVLEDSPLIYEPIISHADYDAAELDTPVLIETYVQGKQGWWEDNGVGQASFYAQDNPEGGYFFYNMPCTKEQYDEIIPGTHIRVYGYKSEWSGEVEITDAIFMIIPDDGYIATAHDVTDLLGKDELIKHQNEFVSFKGMTVEPANDEGLAFMYKWDNSGSEGDDLYFNVSKDGTTYTFTVESYLCGPETDVYKAVKALNVGDVIDLEGFLYWYNGANPHITNVTKA